MTDERYLLVLARPAERAISEELPEAAAAAVIEFITGALLDNPQRVGKPLRYELAGLYGARRGTFRIVYSIDDEQRRVIVRHVDHRRDVYRAQ